MAELPQTLPSEDIGNGETVGTNIPVVPTQNTNSNNPPETTTEDPESAATIPEDTVQTQPKETAPPATTKPVDSAKPTESTASTDEKLDPDELPLVPNT